MTTLQYLLYNLYLFINWACADTPIFFAKSYSFSDINIKTICIICDVHREHDKKAYCVIDLCRPVILLFHNGKSDLYTELHIIFIPFLFWNPQLFIVNMLIRALQIKNSNSTNDRWCDWDLLLILPSRTNTFYHVSILSRVS